MALREQLAWNIARLANLGVAVADTPRSQLYYAIRYGTLKKFRNFIKARVEYKKKALVLSSLPYEVRIEPASVCNLRCPLCPTGNGQVVRQRSLMTEQTFAKILTELGEYVFYSRMYVWGDPLMNKRLWRLVSMAEQAAVGTEISTNLSFKLSDEQIDRLIESGLSWLIVSLDGTTAESYSRYRKGGDFDLVISNMRRLAQRRRALGSRTPYLEWQFIPFRHNEHEIKHARRLVKTIGFDSLRLKPTRVDKVASSGEIGDVESRLAEEWLPRSAKLRTHGKEGRTSLLPYHCRFLWGHATIYPDGALGPCCETHLTDHDIGNLSDGRFEAIWNSPVYQRYRRTALFGAKTAMDEDIPCHTCTVFAKYPDTR